MLYDFGECRFHVLEVNRFHVVELDGSYDSSFVSKGSVVLGGHGVKNSFRNSNKFYFLFLERAFIFHVVELNGSCDSSFVRIN